jgi:FKBP-type peptidyl-prolyl cis-trans isomerase FklB
MKKILFVALAILVSASFNTVSAQSKKKKKGDVEAAAPVQQKLLTTANDTLSYVSGMALTNGLVPFLQQQYGISEEDIPAVVEGIKSAVAQRKNPNTKGFHAGEQVADMVINRMLPSLQKDFKIGTDSLNEDKVFEGFIAGVAKDSTYYTYDNASKLFDAQRLIYKNRLDSINKAAGEAFLAENKTKEGVVTLPSGLQYKVLVKGNGAIPKPTDKVDVVYEGKTIDGHVFDATSRHRGREFDTFTPNALIKGWQEALTIMPVGSKWELYIPYDLAYGERGAGNEIPAYSALIFTMELKNIEAPTPATTTTAPAPTTTKPTPRAAKTTPAKRTPSRRR